MRVNRKTGFTLVEVMIVVAIIGLLAAIAVPNFIRARQTSQRNACINNLRQIDGAKATWALEQKKDLSAVPNMSELHGATNYIRDEPKCPANGTYGLNAVNIKPTCSQASDGHVLP